ncbi:MAG: hypothetical protein AAGD14_00915 [Planctomycetota bacterium]
MLLLAACARTQLAETEVAGAGKDELDFWDAVATVRAVSNHDALYALLLTYEIDPGADYAARVAMAKKRGWIREKDTLPEKETARTGWIAKAVCIESGIKGGVTMRVFGARERYAVNELNYRRWLPDLTPQQAMTGLQLIALLGEAEDDNTGAPTTNPEDLPK